MDNRPRVFPTPEQIAAANQTGGEIANMQEQAITSGQVSTSEAAAAAEMARRTYEQLKAREEALRRAELEKEMQANNSEPSMMNIENAPQQQVYSKPITSPIQNLNKEVNSDNSIKIAELSQPQMNQPYDVIPLPSEGKLYKNKKGRVKVAYLTAADENLLTSPNLLSSDDFLEILINRKLLEYDLRYKDLLPGDRDAIMIWLRSTGYGEMYPVTVLDENDVPFETEIDLLTLKVKNLNILPDEDGLFTFTLPLSKAVVRFKLLTMGEIEELVKLAEFLKEKNNLINTEPTLILENQIVEVNGNRDKDYISEFIDTMRLMDSKELRKYINSIECGVDTNVTFRTPGGVQSAAGEMHGVVEVLDIWGALVLGHVEAAVVAADAGSDLVLTALFDLGDPLGIDQVLAGDSHGVQTAGGDLLGGLDGIHAAGAGDGLVGELLYMLHVLQVAVIRHILRRMCPVPGVVGAVVAVEHVVAGIAEYLDGLLGLFHVAAELHEVLLIRHGALAPGLGLGHDGVAQGHGEVVARLALDRPDYIGGEAQTVFQGSAVLIGAVVHVGDGELVQSVALVDGVDLNAVDAGFAQTFRGLAEGVDHLLDLFFGQGAGFYAVVPAVGSIGRGSAYVLHVDDGAGQFVEKIVLRELDHPVGDGHGAAGAGSQLDEQLRAGLVELFHVLLELFELIVVLIQPFSAGNAERVLDELHSGENKPYAVLGSAEQEMRRFFVEVVGLHPAEKIRASHGALDYAVLDLYIAYLPGGKQCIVLFVHVVNPFFLCIFCRRRACGPPRLPTTHHNIIISVFLQ